MRVEPISGEPALMIKGRRRVLVVADLHLGLVRYYDDFIIEKIESLAENFDEVIILGDLKHHFGDRLNLPFDFTLVKGNHDGKLEGEREIRIGKIQLIHGHIKPKEVGKFLIVAHAHPSIYLHGVKERVWIFGDWKDSKVLVVPAFNDLCSSTPVNLRRPAGFIFKEWNYLEGNVLTLDCTFLGKVKDLNFSTSQQPPLSFSNPSSMQTSQNLHRSHQSRHLE